jgi:hypothetical protein
MRALAGASVAQRHAALTGGTQEDSALWIQDGDP